MVMRGRKYTYAFITGAILVVASVMTTEIAARIYLHDILEKSTRRKFRFNSYRVYEHVPGFREGNDERDWIVIDEHGFRRTEPVSKTKPSDTFRVFLLGGSAAHGISSAPPYPVRHIYPEETIDARLEARLEAVAGGRRVEVINAAVTGYQVFQHTSYLTSELLDYDPDLVIFLDGANDHYVDNPEFAYQGDFVYQFWKERLQAPSAVGMFDYASLWASDHSALARGVFAWRLQRDARERRVRVDSIRPITSREALLAGHRIAARRGFLRAIEANLEILESAGVDAIVALQPMLVLRDPAMLSAAERGFLRPQPHVVELYPTVVDEVREIARAHGATFVDTNPAFDDPAYRGQQLLIDYCHLSPEGGDVVAGVLFPFVRERMQRRIAVVSRRP